jgi:protein-tyrosine phosphatase
MNKIFAKYEKDNEVNINKTYIEPTKITDNIFIGSVNSVNENELKKLNITTIIIAGKRLKNDNHNNFNCLELLIDDSLEQDLMPYFNMVYDYISNSVNENELKKFNILIHCYSGISRSGAILISYLMKKNNWSYEYTYSYVKNIYEPIFPNENFQNQLKKLNFNS